MRHAQKALGQSAQGLRLDLGGTAERRNAPGLRASSGLMLVIFRALVIDGVGAGLASLAGRASIHAYKPPILWALCQAPFFNACIYVLCALSGGKRRQYRGPVSEGAYTPQTRVKPYLRVFRGVSKYNLPGYVGFFQFLRNFHQLTAFEQAEMILYAALDPSIASKAKKGEFVKCLDHFDLLQSARNWALIMASATPFCFCTTQKHLTAKMAMNSRAYTIISPTPL
jgi:hypothetical protein